jgi:heme oxygenase
VPAIETPGATESSSLATSHSGPESVAAISALRTATWPYHQRLEKRLDVKQRFSERRAYGAHLARMWGFCAGLERSIDPQCLRPALADYALRSKLALLEQDLCALGYSAGAIAQLPACPDFASCRETATAFGRLYVIEGATLGGRSLLPLVSRQLGCSAVSGAAFLASYGDEVQGMWQRFGAALDLWCVGAERIGLATAAAIATFEVLELWLCGERP